MGVGSRVRANINSKSIARGKIALIRVGISLDRTRTLLAAPGVGNFGSRCWCCSWWCGNSDCWFVELWDYRVDNWWSKSTDPRRDVPHWQDQDQKLGRCLLFGGSDQDQHIEWSWSWGHPMHGKLAKSMGDLVVVDGLKSRLKSRCR